MSDVFFIAFKPILFFSVDIVSMQKIMSLVAVGFAEIFSIKFFNFAVLVALTDRRFLVGGVNSLGTNGLNVNIVEYFCGLDRLQSLCFQCHSDIHKQMNSRSAEGHKASSIASLERFKSQHQPPTESSLPTPGGMNLLQPPSDSEIHLPSRELRD